MHQREMPANLTRAIQQQQENANITYTVNWIPRLDGDTIATSTWTAENSGATIASESNTTQKASAKFSGTPGRYLFTNKVTLSGGDVLEFQFQLIIKDNDAGFVNDYWPARDYH